MPRPSNPPSPFSYVPCFHNLRTKGHIRKPWRFVLLIDLPTTYGYWKRIFTGRSRSPAPSPAEHLGRDIFSASRDVIPLRQDRFLSKVSNNGCMQLGTCDVISTRDEFDKVLGELVECATRHELPLRLRLPFFGCLSSPSLAQIQTKKGYRSIGQTILHRHGVSL